MHLKSWGTTRLSPQMCRKPLPFKPPLLLWPWGLGGTAVCAMLGSCSNSPGQADQGRYARAAAPNAEPKKHPFLSQGGRFAEGSGKRRKIWPRGRFGLIFGAKPI